MLRRTLVVVLFVLWVGLSAGCGTLPPKEITQLPEAAKLKTGEEGPLRYKVAFAPVRLVQKTKPTARYSAAVEPDPKALRDEFVKVLETFSVFKELKTIEDSGKTDPLQAAKEQGAVVALYYKTGTAHDELLQTVDESYMLLRDFFDDCMLGA